MSNSPVSDKWGEYKAWYQSKTIWGVLIALAGTAIRLLFPESGVDVEGATDVVLEEGDSLATGIDNVYSSVITLIGLAVAAWGRFKASVGIK